MNQLIHLQKMNVYTVLLLVLKIVLLGSVWQIAQADESENQPQLVIKPASPTVAKGQSFNLTVYGAKGNITWIEGLGTGKLLAKNTNHITYTAPNEVGQYRISVSADNGAAAINVTVLTKEGVAQAFSAENANWEVFTNRDGAFALLSDNKEILWVGTGGGLEQREASTGKLIRFYTNMDGLPGNGVEELLSDGNGGIWIGTSGGIAHLHIDGTWDVFRQDNSPLPTDNVRALLSDAHGGIWIGTNFGGSVSSGLAHLHADGKWEVFKTNNSELPNNAVVTLASDDKGGVWVGTGADGIVGIGSGGVVHIHANDTWEVFHRENSPLQNNHVTSLLSDNSGGVWVGTYDETPYEGLAGGLAHLHSDGTWEIFNKDNSGLLTNTVYLLCSDGEGGIWLDSGDDGSLTRFHADGHWEITDIYDVYSATLADENSGLWIGTGDNLLYLNSDGHLKMIDKDKPTLPSGWLESLFVDNTGSVWVGTLGGGLGHLRVDGSWEIFNRENSELPNDAISSIISDGNGGLWVGTWNGVAHFHADDTWEVFDTNNSILPHDKINALQLDGNGGIWVATGTGLTIDENNTLAKLVEGEGGLAHIHANGTLEVFDSKNSGLPNEDVRALLPDNSGGIWVGTGGGLAHFHTDNTWEIFDISNSKLPNDEISVLTPDGKGGIWIGTNGFYGTSGGLAHLSAENTWKEIFTTHNSLLPSNKIESLLSDGNGGIWVATNEVGFDNGGLAHIHVDGTWEIFNMQNSGLPDNSLDSLQHDGDGGIWVATMNELAHITFSQKPFICATTPDITDDQCKKLLKGSRTTILIHPNGQDNSYAIDVMATSAYQTLVARGYYNDEIYYLSYQPDLDFNGDGFADHIVDGPITLTEFRKDVKPRDLTVDDVKIAFKWATEKSLKAQDENIPEEPLLVIFVGHGSTDELILSLSGERLDETTIKNLIGDYQTATGNQVVVTLEACHSGTLINGLKANNRVIISSTDENLAYYSDSGRISFTNFYFEQLYAGVNYWNGWKFVKEEPLQKIRRPQNPQLEDSANNVRAKKLCLNGCFGKLPEPTMMPEISHRYVSKGDYVDLIVNIEESNVHVTDVAVSIITPKQANEHNKQGFELNAPLFKKLTKNKEDDKWLDNFEQFTDPGEYKFFFKADYKINIGTRTVNAKPPLTVYLKPCDLERTCFDSTINRLYLPAVRVQNFNGKEDIYQADLVLQNAPELTFELDMESLKPVSDINLANATQFQQSTGIVHIPKVEIHDDNADSVQIYSADLQLVPQTEPLQFHLKNMNQLTDK